MGNLPTADGTSATVQPGSILAVSPQGTLLAEIVDPKFINGPWGMAIREGRGTDRDARNGNDVKIFVSNVLNGTITRFDVQTGPQNKIAWVSA